MKHYVAAAVAVPGEGIYAVCACGEGLPVDDAYGNKPGPMARHLAYFQHYSASASTTLIGTTEGQK